MKKYWFVLFPDTFLWVKDSVGITYNTKNHAKVKFVNDGELAEITSELLDINNLYCIRVTEEQLKHESVNVWIHDVVASKCGNLVEDDGQAKRPLSLPPILKVQDGVGYYKWEHKQHIDGNVIQNLHQIVFHIAGSEFGNDLYSKQTLYPMKTEAVLDIEKIHWFAKNARCSSFLSEISLVGNPFKIPRLVDEIVKLKDICTVSLYVALQDAIQDLSQIKELSAIATVNLLVTDYALLEQLPDISSWSKDISFVCIVTSEQEYATASGYVEEHSFELASIVPIYTGSNGSFFENYLFIDEGDIQEIALSKRDVYIRQALNIFNFGKLFVAPGGSVYSNLNNPPIGTIDEPPHDIVYREITEGKSWLNIRDQQPCCDCVYQWLCPSPSNYEQVKGRHNLCHIKNEI